MYWPGLTGQNTYQNDHSVGTGLDLSPATRDKHHSAFYKPSIHFINISYRAALRCKTIIFLLTSAACSAICFLETQIPGLKPGAMDIIPPLGYGLYQYRKNVFMPSRIAAKLW
jgi:hypothetical protein